MDVHRLAGENDLARARAQAVIDDNLAPDGTELSPMRIAECRLTLAFVAGREGDLEQAVALGRSGLKNGRQSVVHLQMVAGELHQELRARYPGEALVSEFGDAIRAL
ncbi:hypothetical protein [Kribbella flavida]|uniref:hypothetical protein n=1 Tax=Kribbella flavida TaxID=182640 RepID=UPI00019BF868|nr:hypothetical protein [Kribbella flavida]